MSNDFRFDSNIHGIQVNNVKQENGTNAAIASLRLALKNYFSTYQFSERITIQDNIEAATERHLASLLSYQEKYLQTIFHFHHFIELLIKDELRLINPILAVKLDTDNGRNIMNLIKNKTNSGSIGNRTVEFMVALKRLYSLADSECKIGEIIKKHKRGLTDLNTLRNRAWHRGTFVLLYRELDRFIGTNILPCIIECMEYSIYKGSERFWKYKSPKIDIDPIKKIIEATKKPEINYSEVAFYKAIGLASYDIPLEFGTIGKRYMQPSEKKAKALLGSGSDADEVLECFVCGKQSLVSYREDDWDHDEQGQPINGWWRIYEVECQECHLRLDRHIGNPKKYGVEIPDLWLGEEY
ncbi:hypothetical protein [Rossellomorea vietnamensis]|uniref:hypothetical protein n=1 Tax=Rossellomorea vietnamensis TaxID=218284 RepID=UPI00054F5065|nr:hypothetical protein [Rossellomorea vietnamensis]